MALTEGGRLGPYEIIELLGAGGMGEVYRARDTRLDRQVAIKVLPADLSGNEQFQARFEREAKTISQLNHPNICTLHDVGNENGVSFLVMELLEGEPLDQVLDRGALPLDQAIRYGIQIANALDCAHRHRIVHRDLKPANVMITATGAKLLDFGLAKAALEAAQPIDGLTDLETEQRNLTEEGTILGTVQYMAPEQLEGLEADARTDLFAFGVLLFEMITGRKTFQGTSRVSLMAAIMEHPAPSISSIQPLSPPALDRLIRTCLEKKADDRWQTAHDIELQLRWIEEVGSDVGLPAPVVARRKGRARLSWAFTAVGLVAALTFAWLWLAGRAEPERLARFSVVPAEGTTLEVGWGLAISPDGSRIVFAARDDSGARRLFVRTIDALEPTVVSGSENARFPFWSPDGAQIGFVVDDRLKRVAAAGGPPQTICNAPGFRGGAWGPDGVIVFSSGGGGGRGILRRVPAGGGPPTPLTTLDEEREEFSHRWPSFLPDGEHVLFVAQTGEGNVEGDESTLEVLSLESGDRTRVVGANSSVQYVSTGHILFWRGGNVLAQRFDPKALAVTGDPMPVLEGVGYSDVELAAFSVSAEGTLVYQAGVAIRTQLTWFDRNGNSLETLGHASSAGLAEPALSWDGSKVAYALERDIWVRDLARGTATRLTFSGKYGSPIWSPDDEWIAYWGSGGGIKSHIYRKRASGVGDEELLLPREQDSVGNESGDWSSDGRSIVFHTFRTDTLWDIARFDLTDGTVEDLIRTPFQELAPSFSPDGNWLAAMSNETGRMEIYVYRLTVPGGRWQLSAAGGTKPIWSRDGRTIYYHSPSSHLMAVEVETGETFHADPPVELMKVASRPGDARAYDVTADGSRFLWNARAGGSPKAIPLTIIQNWPGLLQGLS